MAGELKHNYIRDKKNYQRDRAIESEKSYKHRNEKKIENEKKYGDYYDLLLEGVSDRIAQCPPNTFDDTSMQTSYSYGYFERGSSVLAGEFERKKYTEEEQRLFGIIDLQNGVEEKHLRNLVNYSNYMSGRIYQKGRKIYEYITENNLEIEEYIKLMCIVSPEVLNPEFINGYYDEQKSHINGKNSR